MVNAAKDMGLNLKNLVGVGTNNVSVMTGVNNGDHKILKEEFCLPHLVLATLFENTRNAVFSLSRT